MHLIDRKASQTSDRDYCAMGETLKQQGKLAEAIACYHTAIAQYPQSAWAQFHLGKALQQNGQIVEAVAHYQAAIRLQPDFPFVYSPLRYAPLPQRSPLIEELIAFYQEMIPLNPQVSALSINLAAAFTQQGRVKEAIPYLQTAIQQQTLTGYPEWQEKGWKLATVNAPDFIIIGAPRCGTTSLYRYLTSHPQVLAAAEKEIRFFSQEFDRGLDWYLAHFPPVPTAAPTVPIYRVGEATPTYLAHPLAAQRLQQCFPTTKLIVILRNPVCRTFSHYQMLVRRGTEQRSFEAAIAHEQDVLATATDTDLEQGQHWRTCDYLAKSLYVYDLRRWLACFPRDQFLLLQSETFYTDPAQTLNQVFDFLGLPHHGLDHYPKYNAAPYLPIQPDTRLRLSEYFQPYNQQLEREFDRSFGW